MKIMLLFVVLALLLAACAAPVAPVETTTEEFTTEYITTTQEETTAFAYVYLTEAEIDEIFMPAWRLLDYAVRGPSLNITDTDIEYDGYTWRFAINPQFNSVEELVAALHEHFSPQLVEEYMNYRGFPMHMNHDDGLLHRCLGGWGSSGVFLDHIRIVAQTETQVSYQLQWRAMWDDALEHCAATRQLINDHWVFTQFYSPRW
ncbi:MAG: hypothetical protein FWD06_08100 [Oscillospiraceae bacterium]|nr:hypothetical protein [Oscillospiraceae bacterium]